MADFIRQETPPVDCSSRNSYVGMDLNQRVSPRARENASKAADAHATPFYFRCRRPTEDPRRPKVNDHDFALLRFGPPPPPLGRDHDLSSHVNTHVACVVTEVNEGVVWPRASAA